MRIRAGGTDSIGITAVFLDGELVKYVQELDDIEGWVDIIHFDLGVEDYVTERRYGKVTYTRETPNADLHTDS